MKVVINRCYGGFGLSDEVFSRYNAITGKNYQAEYEIQRSDPVLIQVIEELGLEASGGLFSKLKIVEIPDGISWFVSDYDGMEHIAEHHRTWN